MVSKPPVTERGTASVHPHMSGGGLLKWNALLDTTEHVPELRWPNSIRVYDMMRTDSQINGMWLGMTLPIRRYRWALDPNGASPNVVSELAEDLGLDIVGQDPINRRSHKRQFSFDRHLYHVLLALIYGSMYFNQVGDIDADLRWRLQRLSPRMPATISEINLHDNGDLKSIKQEFGLRPVEISADELVAYVWDQEGADWIGRSMFRPLYKHWLIKDRLLRVDAIKHERNGVGVPMIEAPPGASSTTIAALADLAEELKAGERSGGALPSGAKLSIVGTQGSIPDTIGSIRYHDEAIARSMLEMFAQLGQTQTGSRALGDTFVDFLTLAQQTVALWVCDTFNPHVIEDWVDWNYGEDEQPPRLVFEAQEDPYLAVSDLATLVEKRIVTVDDDLEDEIRRRHKLPARAESDEPREPVTPEPVTPEPAVPDIEPSQASRSGERTASSSRAHPHAQTGRTRRRAFAAKETVNEAFLPDRELRRQPYEHEVRAQTDFAAIEALHTGAVDKLLLQWQDIHAAQVDDLAAQIAAAKGDLVKLAQIEATPIGADTLRGELLSVMEDSANLAVKEAARQGAPLTKPALDDAAARIAARAEAMDLLLSKGLSEAAGRQAIARTAPSLAPKEVAEQVRDHLMNLSDAYIKSQFNGAVQQAENVGRMEVFDSGDPSEIYASELLDSATCEFCVEVDGTEYRSVQDSEADYPSGGYKDCAGGPNCRGSIVAVFGEGGADDQPD